MVSNVVATSNETSQMVLHDEPLMKYLFFLLETDCLEVKQNIFIPKTYI